MEMEEQNWVQKPWQCFSPSEEHDLICIVYPEKKQLPEFPWNTTFT